MKLPKRPDTHVTEAESSRLLQAIALKEWIVREVSERDYGIDAYIELASKDGHITGDLMSVQLKGVREINWKEKDSSRSARSPRIKSSTANYGSDCRSRFFSSLSTCQRRTSTMSPRRRHCGRQFGNLDKQASITFTLRDKLSLKSKIGKALLPWFHDRERMHGQFSFHTR